MRLRACKGNIVTTRVLFVGAGNPLRASSGMDVVEAAHILELTRDPRLRVTVISALPGKKDVSSERGNISVFAPDFAGDMTAGHRLGLKIGFILQGGLLNFVGFLSQAARQAIAHAMQQRPEVIIIDHLAAMANVSLRQLLWMRLRHGSRIVFIAHDVTSQFLRDAALFKANPIRKAVGIAQAVQAGLYERLLFSVADKVVFISEYDRKQFAGLSDHKAVSLCPIVEPAVDTQALPAPAERRRFVVFIGSPSFFPNAHAIGWIINALAPALAARGSTLRILLVGKGTDAIDTASAPNVEALGFVPDDELHRLLRGSSGLLSPVIYGSGLKIKILDAIASACPVLATEQSLRGYEFMDLQPVIQIEHPDQSARAICEMVDDPERVLALEKHIKERWSAYKARANGQLAELVLNLP